MQSSELYNLYNNYNQDDVENSMNDLATEIPIGWSSTCLDQTIHYYIECNVHITESKDENRQ